MTCSEGFLDLQQRGACHYEANRPLSVQPWQVPKSKVYSHEEWEALHRESAETGKPAALQSPLLEEAVTAEPVVKQEVIMNGKVVKERRGLTLKERLEICQATERQRLTFCKVRISLSQPE